MLYGHGLEGLHDEAGAAKRCGELARRADQYFDPVFDEFRYLYRLYAQQEERNPIDDTLSDIFPPVLASHIDTMVARLHGAMTATRPPFRMKTNRFSLDTYVEMYEEMVALQWERASHSRALLRCIKNTLITSIGWMKYGWKREFSPQGEMLENRLEAQSILPIFMKLDPEAGSFEESWIIQERVMRRSQLMKLAQSGQAPLINLDSIAEITGDDEREVQLHEQSGLAPPGRVDEDASDPVHKILEFQNDHWKFWIEAESEKLVMRPVENTLKTKQFCWYQAGPMDGLFVGRGPGHLLAQMQEAMKTLERARMNYISFQTYPQYQVARDAGVDHDRLYPKPYGIVEHDAPPGQNPIGLLPKANTPPDMDTALDHFARYAESVSHFNEDARGESPKRKETVGATYQRIEEGSKSLVPMIQEWNEYGIKRGAELTLKFLRMNMMGTERLALQNRNDLPASAVAQRFPDMEMSRTGEMQVDVNSRIFDDAPLEQFDVVAEGSSAVASKEARMEQTGNLAAFYKELGLLENPDVAETVAVMMTQSADIPGRDILLKKLREHYAQARQEGPQGAPQMIPPGMGGPPPGGPPQ